VLGRWIDKIRVDGDGTLTLEAMARALFQKLVPVDFDPVPSHAGWAGACWARIKTLRQFPDQLRRSPLPRHSKGMAKSKRISESC